MTKKELMEKIVEMSEHATRSIQAAEEWKKLYEESQLEIARLQQSFSVLSNLKRENVIQVH